MKLLASCVLASALFVTTSAEAKQDVPAPPGNTGGAPAVVGVPLALESPPPVQTAVPELPPESDMYSVGMYAGGIALVVGGIVNSAIGIGIIAAFTSGGGDGFGSAFAIIIGVPVLFDGTVQISIGIPMIVVGGADAEPNPIEQAAQAGQLPTRSGLTLAIPF